MRTAFILLASFSLAADWPGWRGPTGMGHTTESNLPLTWGGKDGANVLWKTALPGVEANAGQDQNQSSPVVAGGKVFVTASYWPGGKADPKAYPEHHVVCYRVSDGKQLWDSKVEPGPWLFADLRGGYTAPTPAVDGERVYVVFGSSVIAAFDLDGKPVWRKEVVPFKFDVALGASPVLFGDTVILQCDELEQKSRLVAFDKKTGNVKWEELRPKLGFAHSTPVLATIGGKPQLLVSASNSLQGVDPSNGKLIWWCDAKGDTVSPVIGGGIVYIDTGRGGPGYAVDPTGMENVTKTHLKWNITQMPEGYSSPVIVGEYLYRLHSPETLKCINLSNGKEIYSERFPGASTSSSPIATADGNIYLASGGKSYVLKAGPKVDILATNDLGDGSHASPAVADGKLFIKGKKWLYCIGTVKK
jgi:outer membrane protein assembly factor BamB